MGMFAQLTHKLRQFDSARHWTQNLAPIPCLSGKTARAGKEYANRAL